MERLTEKCWRNLDPWECCGQDNYCQRGCHEEGGCTKGCIVPKIYDRLAEYEDTGLDPKEIAEVQVAMNLIPFGRFYDIMDAERDGRLVVLPCKVESHVWVIEGVVRKGLVSGFSLYSDWRHDASTLSIQIEMDLGIGSRKYWYGADKLGKTVFLTRDEAEAALAQMQNNVEAK